MKISTYYPYRSAEAKERYLSLYELIAKEWPIASESRMVSTTYGETFVRVSGPDGAQPLVLLPGVTATSLLWATNIEGLSRQYRTYALDRAGDIGRSTCTKPMRDLSDILRWLEELFTALDLGDQINLVGLSYGGWLTAEYALHFPNRLRKIVLLAPGATVLRTRAEFYVRMALVLTGRRYFARAAVYWLLEDLARKDASRVEKSVDRVLLTLRCLPLRRPIGPTVLTDQELKSLGMPTLFVVGEHEKIYSAAQAVQRLNRVAPHIRTETIPNAGHDLTIVQPETVNWKILEFLK
jgi:pimeloyl-ACP methyl ester carboxylesterase